jgi:hypothetical protein
MVAKNKDLKKMPKKSMTEYSESDVLNALADIAENNTFQPTQKKCKKCKALFSTSMIQFENTSCHS